METDSQKTQPAAHNPAEAWYAVHEKWKTVRLIVVCIAILIGLGMILHTAEHVLEKPGWITLVLACLASIAPPSVLLWRTQIKFKAYMKRDHQRTIELEGHIDRQRESSGLNTDGSVPRDEP